MEQSQLFLSEKYIGTERGKLHHMLLSKDKESLEFLLNDVYEKKLYRHISMDIFNTSDGGEYLNSLYKSEFEIVEVNNNV